MKDGDKHNGPKSLVETPWLDAQKIMCENRCKFIPEKVKESSVIYPLNVVASESSATLPSRLN
jgi:hypothetical protein